MKRKFCKICFIFVSIILVASICISEHKKSLRNNINQAILLKNSSNKFRGEKSYLNSNTLEVQNVKVIAHRGQCSGEPENSLKAIQSSIKYKVNYAEIDVQETEDGVVVLMHDRNLKRLTGLNKNVDQLTFNEIEKLNIGSPFHKKDVERIPTLDEVIKKCNRKLDLIIEIKPYGNTEDLTNKVVKIIDVNNYVSQCKVHSVSYKILLDIKKLNPNIQTGYIVSRPMNNLSLLNVNFYSIQENAINEKMVHDIHKVNKEIYAWTVDRKVDMNNMLKLNLDGIISDKPQMLLNIKKENKIFKL
ncbi:glycerophosphodiester phosphodiesterase [Clostridium sp. JS66]|uniref:glycerophosphodiester phosphodiesterase n=1 Tax=Clostridium sp. JS66 TaxID=3064705 RepID=UPI00298DFFE4|nr:glycerophosphodiester phosphodiesterase [Clostridium sp. JS66]WPC44358.1 glycerophosphodiester phosphodiesterase [Clostridium sp. JS66]